MTTFNLLNAKNDVVGAELCRTVALQEQDWTPLSLNELFKHKPECLRNVNTLNNPCGTYYSLFFISIYHPQLEEEHVVMEPSLSGVAMAPQGLKRKAETPLGSSPEPGQVMQEEPSAKAPVKSRVSNQQ